MGRLLRRQNDTVLQRRHQREGSGAPDEDGDEGERAGPDEETETDQRDRVGYEKRADSEQNVTIGEAPAGQAADG